MAALITLSVATFLFGVFIFLRGQHTMHQLQALIFFMFSALFLAIALLLKDIKSFLARRRRTPAEPVAVAAAEIGDTEAAAERRPDA